MRKLCLMSAALALAASVSFWIGTRERAYSPEALAQGTTFPKVNIDLTIVGIDESFRAGVTGLEASCEIIESVNPGDLYVRKRPGRTKYSNITLKRGYTTTEFGLSSKALYDWFSEVKQGKIEGKDGTITLVSDDGVTHAEYEFFDAWPCKWKGFSLSSTAGTFPAEEIEMVVQKMRKRR